MSYLINWSGNPFLKWLAWFIKNSKQFNQSYITSDIAALALTLTVSEPQHFIFVSSSFLEMNFAAPFSMFSGCRSNQVLFSFIYYGSPCIIRWRGTRVFWWAGPASGLPAGVWPLTPAEAPPPAAVAALSGSTTHGSAKLSVPGMEQHFGVNYN